MRRMRRSGGHVSNVGLWSLAKELPVGDFGPRLAFFCPTTDSFSSLPWWEVKSRDRENKIANNPLQ